MENNHHLGHVKYAGFWIRFAARFLDGIIVAAILIVANVVLGTVGGYHNPLLPLIDLVIAFGYFCHMTKKYGATYGKQVLNIRVVAEDGSHLTNTMVVMREIVGKIASGIILDIGYLMVAFTKRKQGLHDKIAETVVVHTAPHTHNRKHVVALNVATFTLLIVVLFVVLAVTHHS